MALSVQARVELTDSRVPAIKALLDDVDAEYPQSYTELLRTKQSFVRSSIAEPLVYAQSKAAQKPHYGKYPFIFRSPHGTSRRFLSSYSTSIDSKVITLSSPFGSFA